MEEERAQIDPRQTVLHAANVTVAMMKDARLAKMAQHMLTLLTADMAALMQPTDRGGLFMPVRIGLGSRRESGAILVLEDRALFGWFTGTFKRKIFAEVVPLASISAISQADWKGLAQLNVAVPDRVWAVFPYEDGGGRSAGMLRAVLDGSLKPPAADLAEGQPAERVHSRHRTPVSFKVRLRGCAPSAP